MVDIFLAAAAAHSPYDARQGGHPIPDFSRSDGFRFMAGLAALALVVAGLSLSNTLSQPASNQNQGNQHAGPAQDRCSPRDAQFRPQADRHPSV
jgi:hypothetical protein